MGPGKDGDRGCLVQWGPGIQEGLIPPWYEGRACWVCSVPTGAVHTGMHACMCACRGAHTCALEGGGLSSELTPRLPGSLAARFARLTAPLLGAQHAPPSPSAGSGWPPSEDAIERICTLLGEVGGQVT